MYEDSYEPNLAEFAFGAPDLSLASSGGGGFGDLDASLWRDAGLGFMGYEMPGTGAAPNNGLSLHPDGYQAFNGMDAALWSRASLNYMPALHPQAQNILGTPYGANPYGAQEDFLDQQMNRYQVSPPSEYRDSFGNILPPDWEPGSTPPLAASPLRLQPGNVPNGLGFPSQPRVAPAARPANGLPPMPEPQLGRNGPLGGWAGNAGAGNAAAGAGNDALARLVAAQNQNLAAARNAALADRHRALTSAQSLRNPYDAAFQDKARLQQQDERGRQLAAAEATLVAQYAQMGRVVDPATLAMLRMRVAQADNADLRNLQLATTGASFAADLSRNDALYRVLAETNYLPGNLDPALMLQLARANGIANN